MHSYSYTTYSNSTTYCTRGKHDLTKGFVIYADMRFRPSMAVHDLVWSVDPAEAKQYNTHPGIPSAGFGYSDTGPKAWVKDRYAQNERKIRGKVTSAIGE